MVNSGSAAPNGNGNPNPGNSSLVLGIPTDEWYRIIVSFGPQIFLFIVSLLLTAAATRVSFDADQRSQRTLQREQRIENIINAIEQRENQQAATARLNQMRHLLGHLVHQSMEGQAAPGGAGIEIPGPEQAPFNHQIPGFTGIPTGRVRDWETLRNPTGYITTVRTPRVTRSQTTQVSVRTVQFNLEYTFVIGQGNQTRLLTETEYRNALQNASSHGIITPEEINEAISQIRRLGLIASNSDSVSETVAPAGDSAPPATQEEVSQEDANNSRQASVEEEASSDAAEIPPTEETASVGNKETENEKEEKQEGESPQDAPFEEPPSLTSEAVTASISSDNSAAEKNGENETPLSNSTKE